MGLFGFFFFNDTATTEIYTLSLHDALPIYMFGDWHLALAAYNWGEGSVGRAIKRNEKLGRSEEHTSELQSLRHLVCRLLLEKKSTEWPNGGAMHKCERASRRKTPAVSCTKF